LIDKGETRGWEKYQKYYEQYKRNQQRAFNFERGENEGD